VLIKPAVDNSLVVGIDRAEDTGKDLEWEFISKLELDLKTSWTEVRQHNLTKIFS
jgi:hypothetical protein